MARGGIEGCLRLISLTDTNEMVDVPELKLSEHSCVLK